MQDDLFVRRDHTTQVEGKCLNILTYSPKKFLKTIKPTKRLNMKTWIPLSLVSANGLESKDFCRPLEHTKRPSYFIGMLLLTNTSLLCNLYVRLVFVLFCLFECDHNITLSYHGVPCFAFIIIEKSLARQCA
jgi:hypothetical protein